VSPFLPENIITGLNPELSAQDLYYKWWRSKRIIWWNNQKISGNWEKQLIKSTWTRFEFGKFATKMGGVDLEVQPDSNSHFRWLLYPNQPNFWSLWDATRFIWAGGMGQLRDENYA